jgi:hypothetical protein
MYTLASHHDLCVYQISPLDQRVTGKVHNQCSHDSISTLKGIAKAVIGTILS